jgi:hypothetical protein
MNRAIAWATVAVLTATITACAPQPHTDDTMLMGTHSMPGPAKPGAMSNQAMPSRSPDCAPEALATMPPEHRLACERGR